MTVFISYLLFIQPLCDWKCLTQHSAVNDYNTQDHYYQAKKLLQFVYWLCYSLFDLHFSISATNFHLLCYQLLTA